MAIRIDPDTGLPVPDNSTEPMASDALGLSAEDHSLLSALAATPAPGESEHDPLDPAEGGEGEGETGYVGQYTGTQLGDATPDQGSAPQEGGSLTPIRQGAKLSTSNTGITDRGIAQSNKVHGRAGSVTDVRNQQFDQQFASDKAGLDQGYADTKSAMAEMERANKDHLDELGKLHAAALDFNQTNADLEQMSAATAKAHGEQYVAGYQQDMATVRQLMLQSGNPLGGLDTTGKLGLAGALFAQGFLGARGTNVNVSGQIDSWVNREMAQHQQMIANQNDAAKGQLTLYNLARQGASDEWEARQRLRGFVIDGLKSQMLMEADRWGSQSAVAAAKQKAAELDLHQIQNLMGLRDKVTDNKFKFMESDRKQAHDQAMESIETRRIAMEQTRVDAELARAKKAAKEAPTPTYITNPGVRKKDAKGNVISGQARDWMIKPDIDNGMMTAAQKVAGETGRYFGGLQSQLDTLRELFKGAKGDMAGPQWFRDKTGPKYRMYKQTLDFINEYAQQKVTGAAAPDDQAERIRGWLKQNNFFEHGNNAGLIDTFENLNRQQFEAAMQNTPGIIAVPKGTLSEDATPGEPTSRYEAYSEASPEARTRAQLRILGQEPTKTGPAGQAYSAAQNVDRNVVTSAPMSGLTKEYLASRPAGFSGDSSPFGSSAALAETFGHQQKFDAVDDLARLIVHSEVYDTFVREHGDIAKKFGMEAKGSPAEVANEAALALSSLASESSDVQDYANYVNQTIAEDKERAKLLLDRTEK